MQAKRQEKMLHGHTARKPHNTPVTPAMKAFDNRLFLCPSSQWCILNSTLHPPPRIPTTASTPLTLRFCRLQILEWITWHDATATALCSPFCNSRQSEMVHIKDLPSDILLDLLSWVPGRDLVRNCRLVCLQWRDLVDLATLWKRKCLREGFDPETPDRSVPDWRIFYFLCIMKRNLIKNPCGEDGFNFWEIESHNGDKWRIEELPGARRRDFPHQPVPKYFVTSQGPCTKQQLISLKKAGYWDELMDETKPDIVVKDWFHCGCPCRYQLRVKLLSANFRVLQEFCPRDVIVEQCSDREWREVSYTFHNYPAGVRHVLFNHGGQGWYGMRITNSSITVGLETGA